MIKVNIGGKYVGRISADGQYGKGSAGIVPLFIPEGFGIKREFKGTTVAEYTFYKEGVGYYTVTAHSFEEALVRARLRGYTRRHYQGKHTR